MGCGLLATSVSASHSSIGMSAAFDTVDHDILLTRLMHLLRYQRCCVVLVSESYLTSRAEYVRCSCNSVDTKNRQVRRATGICSQLLLFILYTVGLIDLIEAQSSPSPICRRCPDPDSCSISRPASSSPPVCEQYVDRHRMSITVLVSRRC